MSVLTKLVLGVLAIVLSVGWVRGCIDDRRRAEEKVLLEAHTKREAEAKQQACMRDLPNLTAQYEALWKQKRYNEAANVLGECATRTGEPALKAAIAAAEIEELTERSDDKQLSAGARFGSLNKLQQLAPDRFQQRAKLHAALQLQMAAEEKRVKAMEAAERRRQGVTVGMTKEEVLGSSWGRPQKVNTTTNAYGTREQWVYGNGNYLYFEGDRLVTIQN